MFFDDAIDGELDRAARRRYRAFPEHNGLPGEQQRRIRTVSRWVLAWPFLGEQRVKRPL